MSENINELSEGGRGIKIMLHVADELSYTRTSADKNCLSIVKNYDRRELDRSENLQENSVLERFIDFSRLDWLKYSHGQQQASDTPLQKTFLQVNTDLNAVHQVLNWYGRLENLPIPQTVFWQCQIALVEGFTNAVRHAHKGLPVETPIELEVKVFKSSLEIKIWDCGQPFDLEAKLSEFRKIDQESLKRKRSRGQNFMLKLVNRVSYKQTYNGQKCLKIVKHALLS